MDLTQIVKDREIVFFQERILNDKNVSKFIPFTNPTYTEPKHLELICKELSEITFDGVKKNICLSAPPQHFKTTTLQHWIALHLKVHPKANIVYMSYNETLAMERVYEITKILTKMGIHPDPKQSTKKQYWTQEGGKLTAAGIDVGFTGRKADIIIIDDPHKSLDDVRSVARMQSLINVFTGVVESREQNDTSVILTHTRWAKGDLIGWVLDNRKKYKYINVPVLQNGKAILPERFNLEAIEDWQTKNPDGFRSMYMGVPPNSMSALFRAEVNGEPLPKYFTDIPNEYESFSIGGDLAYTDKTRADYTVVVRGYKAQGKIYIDHVERWQQDIIYTKSRLKQIYEEYKAPIQLEDNGVQKGIVDMLVNEGIYINRQKVDASKYTRALEFASQWNLGNVYIRRADWNNWFVKELFDFTGSGKEHDDIVDACVYMFRGLQSSLAFA